MFWNLLLNPLLNDLEMRGVYYRAFAYVIILVFSGETDLKIENQANTMLADEYAWGVKNNLKFAANTTHAMTIKNKLKFHTPRIHMCEVKISMVDEINILGLIIDNKLTFLKHVASVQKGNEPVQTISTNRKNFMGAEFGGQQDDIPRRCRAHK